MIFKISSTTDNRTQIAYESAMSDLNEFWGIDWTLMTPHVYIVETRKDMDLLKGRATEPWLVAFATGVQPGDRRVYIFAYDKFATESSWQITEETYSALIKHEICHLFAKIVSKGHSLPNWLNEGLSIYLSGQLTLGRTRPEIFSKFLSGNIKDAYSEGGFVVESLIKNFSKEKIIELVRSHSDSNRNDLENNFKKIYGFDLGYEEINKLH